MRTASNEAHANFVNGEMNRILSQNVHLPLSKNQHERFSQATLLATSEIDSLLETQTNAIATYLMCGGLIGAIGVGFGKTMISLAIANAAYQKGLRKILLLVPPDVAPQLTGRDIPWVRKQIPLNLPINILAGKTAKVRRETSQAKSGLFIMAYSQLSIKDTEELLATINPELIIVDEAHNLANLTSSKTQRVKRYMDANLDTEFVVLSGTLTSKGLMDYQHLAVWALKDKAFLPRTASECFTWSEVLDTSFSEVTVNKTLEPLRQWAAKHYPNETFFKDIAGYRRAYRNRMESTLGVVSSGDKSIATSILIENEPAQIPVGDADFDRLQEYIAQIDDMMLSPNGDELEYAIHKFKWLYELSAGFYNQLSWPTHEDYAQRKGISVEEAESLLDKAKEHHKAKQQYSSKLRKWLQDYSAPGLDTPMLVGGDMHHHGSTNVGSDLYEAWRYVKALEFPEMPERDSKAIRVSDYKIKSAVKWAKKLKKGEGAILWCYHKAMQSWLFEELEKTGLKPVLANAGDQGNEAILNPKNHTRIIVASINAHCTGKNLQAIGKNYLVQFPRKAVNIEQLLGRSHRTGQTRDELVYTTNHTLDFDWQLVSATLADSLYIHQSQNRQKLIYASYNPQPTIFSNAVLLERGCISKDLGHLETELQKRFQPK